MAWINILRRNLRAIPVILLITTPVILGADDARENHAQELVKIAEQRLSEGKTDAALSIANTVLEDFPDTQAAYKAKEIKKLALEKTTSTSGTAKSGTNTRTVISGEPDPASACLWGFLPGGGQFYMGNYYHKVGNKRSANWDYFTGTGIAIGVPGYALLGAMGISQSNDPVIDNNSCIVSTPAFSGINAFKITRMRALLSGLRL